MTICKHCEKPIKWDDYWTTWDHAERFAKLEGELCNPEQGFLNSTYAEPGRP